MNKYEREKVDQIVLAWWHQAFGYQNDIPKQGKSILNDFVTMGGIYSSQGVKPELVSDKAEKLRWNRESALMMYSEVVFERLQVEQRWVLVADYYYNRQEPKKNAQLSAREIAAHLDLTYGQYRDRLRSSRARVLEIDKELRPYIYQSLKDQCA